MPRKKYDVIVIGSGVAGMGSAALLAKEDLTADPDIIDGEGGFGDWVGEFQPELVLKDLGNPFYTASPGAAIKKYNCCFGMHRALDALWQLIWENDITYDQIDSVQRIELPVAVGVAGLPLTTFNIDRLSILHLLAVGPAAGMVRILLRGDLKSVTAFPGQLEAVLHIVVRGAGRHGEIRCGREIETVCRQDCVHRQ